MRFSRRNTGDPGTFLRPTLSPYGDTQAHPSGQPPIPHSRAAIFGDIPRLVPTDPGELLREARRRNQVKQSELARRVGTTQSVISDYERGARSPTVEYLGQMLDALGEELRLEAKPKRRPRGKTSNLLYKPLGER